MSRSILRDKIAEFPNSLKSEDTEMKKRLLIVLCLSILFAFFLIAYLMVWLSGDFDDSQYKDTYRVLVSGGLVLSYYALNNNRRRNMIIGCYNDDGTPIEQVNLSEKGRVYELEVCIVRHPRRYPEYKVDYSSMAFCSSKESAEQIKDEILQSGENWLKDIYCWYIYERVLDVNYDRSEYMACWLYNESGAMIDKRLFPSYWSEDGFIGRSEDEIRFKFGDLVELYDGDTVRLAYVLASPRKKEWYVKKTEENGEPYVGDVSDDTYTIIVKVGKGQFIDYMANHEHVDALSLFHPHYLIPKNISKYWKTFWELYEKDRRECYGDNPLPGQI